ncbi:MAG TPA: transglycosylase domain-containing protein [Sphingobacteriaceae bacterium]
MFRSIKIKPLRYTLILIYLIILSFCAIELNFLWLFGYSPNIRDIKSPNMRLPSELYTADGKLIGRYYKENRTPVEYKDIAPSVIDALIATEDARFFQHSGIDVRSLASSAFSTLTGDSRGASTITQQLAKNLYRTRNMKSQGAIKYVPGARTLIYKVKEWITAFKLENQYSKEEILTLYLNTVPFGSNTYGIKIASKRYFNREPQKLQVEESATLVGMLKANTTYNPIRNPERSLERRNVVLSQMEKYGYLTAAELKKYINRPFRIVPGEFADGVEGDSYLRAAVEDYLEEWLDENDLDLYEGGLKIYTTIDSRLQKYAEEAMQEQMKVLQRRLYNEWGNQDPWHDLEGNPIEDFAQRTAQRLPVYSYLKKKYNNNQDSIDHYLSKPKKMKVFSWNGETEKNFSTYDSLEYYSKILNTGMMTLDPFNGHIKVWIGGIDNDFFKYDHVKQARRQAGSTFKPFAYLAALESGMTPCDRYTDKPVKIEYVENNEQKVWEPKNASYSFSYQEMSLRHAMARSVNSVTAQITHDIGPAKVVEYAHKCGIESDLDAVPSVSLGSNDVSVFEMVKAYATFLNEGNTTEPILVQRVTDNEGNVLEEFKAKHERALSEETAWLMMYMLRGGMEEPGGTSQALWEWDLFKKGNQIGGKTGTSSEYVDGWYMGLTKDLVTGVWVGCDERSVHFRRSETGEGSKTALPIYARFMEKVYRDPATGITLGPFPKPGVEITKNYKCETPRTIIIDTLIVDSTLMDSMMPDSMLEPPVLDEGSLQQDGVPNQPQPAVKKDEKPVVPAQKENTVKKPTENSKREIRRQKRREKRDSIRENSNN